MRHYFKQSLQHPNFYLVKLIKKERMPYILFINGGPGLNCGTLEYMIENNYLFNSFNYNIILYDQRNCGRSRKLSDIVLHKDNVFDLQEIILYLTSEYNIQICSLVGHSYGAKLLFDYYKNFSSKIPGVFISTAKSILTPRLNNLMLDLNYLKKNYIDEYNNCLIELKGLNLSKLWGITERLVPLFQTNKDRPFFYWANLESYQKTQDIKKLINLPMNSDIFSCVRKDLYSDSSNFSVEIDKLTIPKLWINGFHDYIMNGHETALCSNSNATTFYQSSHYPHIEENNYFCEVLNEFIIHQ